ncbi:MAG: hypothetical protein ACHQIG_04785 [Acidimicrobiia bacterium]
MTRCAAREARVAHGSRVAIAVVLAFVGVASCAPRAERAFAQTTGGGELGPGYVRATAADLGAGTFGGVGLPARAPASDPPFTWVHVVRQSVCVVFDGEPPADAHAIPMPGPSFGFPIDPGAPVGVPANTVLVNSDYVLPPSARTIGTLVQEVGDDPTRTGDLVIVPRCVGPNEPPFRAPPSAAEIWQQTPLPRAVIDASPPGTFTWPGITRLGSDFRSGALAMTTAEVSLRGYQVSVSAVPIAYAWAFGDGTDFVSPDAGAAQRVAYLRRGDYTVTRYVVWEGHAQVRAFGGVIAELDLGTVTIPERVPYHVAEIRAVLRTNPSTR